MSETDRERRNLYDRVSRAAAADEHYISRYRLSGHMLRGFLRNRYRRLMLAEWRRVLAQLKGETA